MTGMRTGEATVLQWLDINFDTGILDINKTLYYKSRDDFKFGEPKTKASKRHIVLDSDTLMLLKEWKTSQNILILFLVIMVFLLKNIRFLVQLNVILK